VDLGFNCSNFYKDVYIQALDDVLKEMSIEDATEHGRLIDIKDSLINIGGP